MPEKSSVGIVETRYFTFAEPPNEMVLEGGQKLGPITLAYETYGQLNAERTNAVLIVHALSGDAHVAGIHRADDRKTGWWDAMVGPGKGFDTNKYFVICSNVVGGCMVDRAVLGQPRHRRALWPEFPHHHGRRHGPGAA